LSGSGSGSLVGSAPELRHHTDLVFIMQKCNAQLTESISGTP